MSNPPAPAGFEAVLAEAAPLARRFSDAGFRLYLVGGVVRDHLLGLDRVEQDLDATTEARPDDIKRLVSDLAEAVWTQGERFGTIGCLVDGRPYEITTHRAEVYAEASRKPIVTFGDSLEADLSRRDFTVNAMAVDLMSGELVDPFGGSEHLRRSILATPLDAEVSFSDDPLRMLRAARFHAGYGLDPDAGLLDAIIELGDRMEIVSVERIRDELQKLLLLEQAAAGVLFLHRTGLLARLFPPLAGLHEPEVQVIGRRVEAAAPEPVTRWAAFLLGVDDVRPAFRALKPSGAMERELGWLIGDRSWLDRIPDEHEPLRRAAAGAPEGHTIEERLEFVAAMRRAVGAPVDDVERAAERLVTLRVAESDLDAPVPVLTGSRVCELLDLAPGPEVGVAMDWLADQRFARGPLEAATAERQLLDWWAAR